MTDANEGLYERMPACAGGGSERPPASNQGARSGANQPHECLKSLVDFIHEAATSPTDAGSKYLQDTASNLPARKARRSKFNGAVKVWDEKMPFTQEGESLSNEYVLSIELAHDKRVKRFFFQPQRIQLDYINGNGRRVRTPVTPDCLVETIDGRLALVEMASSEEAARENQARNPRFSKGNADARIIDLPLTEACRQLGIAVLVLTTSDVNHVLFSNLLYLGKGFNTQWQPGEGTKAFVTFIRNCLVADFTDVRLNPQGWTTDDVLGAIVRGMVYVDLRCQRLGDFSNARIYAAREHAEAEALVPKSLPLLPPPDASGSGEQAVDFAAVSEAAMGEAWRRFELIKPYVVGCSEESPSHAIAGYIKAYERAAKELGAGVMGLIPDFSERGFRGPHLCDRVDKLTDEHVELSALQTNVSPDVGKYGALVRACKAESLTPPSRTTFQNRLRVRRAELDSQRAQGGSEGAYQAQPAKSLRASAIARMPQRAWQLGLIDHTPLPIRIVDPITGKPLIGVTPWITYLRDGGTDKALGMYISLSRPSYISVMAVVWDCFRRWGRLPEALLMDGEKPHDSIFVEQLLATFRIDKICRRFLCPRDGSPVERDFKLIIHGMLAYLQGNYVLRPNPHDWPKQWDPAKEAEHTIASLYNACSSFLFGYCNQQLPRKTLGGMTPDAAMAASLRIHGERGFRVHPDPNQARHILLPRHSRSLLKVTRDAGVRPFGESYVPLERIDPRHYGTDVPVRFDPFDITYVLARLGKKWTELKHRHHLKFASLKGNDLAAVSVEIREAAARHERLRGERIESQASILDQIMKQPRNPLGDFVKTLDPENEPPNPIDHNLWKQVAARSVKPAGSYQENI